MLAIMVALAIGIHSANGILRQIPAPAWGKSFVIDCGSKIIQIQHAIFGFHCGVSQNNRLLNVRGVCQGKTKCTYGPIGIITWDPAPNCPKSFEYTYACQDPPTPPPTPKPTANTPSPVTAIPTATTAAPTIFSDPSCELILNHKDVNIGVFSTNLKVTGVENEHDETANTYSIIGNLNANNYIGSDGKYKFQMIYRYADGSVDTLIWKQTSWITDPTITGMEKISVPTETVCVSNYCVFGGLSLTSNQYSYLDGDGSLHAHWFNAAGINLKWNGGIPAFDSKAAISQSLCVYIPTSPLTPLPSRGPTVLPTPLPTPEECETCPSEDILHFSFVVDESGSITDDNFNNYIKQFVMDVIQRDINDVSDINIILYDEVTIELHTFDEQQYPRDTMLHKLAARVYDGGDTHTGEAMKAAIDQFKDKGYTQQNIMFLITDGMHKGGVIEPCSLEQELKDNGITLVVIAVGTTVNNIDLNCADYPFEVQSFSKQDFDAITDDIRGITCIDCKYISLCGENSGIGAGLNSDIDYDNRYFWNGVFVGLLVELVMICCAYNFYACCYRKKRITQHFEFKGIKNINDSSEAEVPFHPKN